MEREPYPPDALHEWRSCRQRAYRSWVWSIAVAVVGTVSFLRSYQRAEPALFAVLLLIVLLSLRSAWRYDRIIRACNAHIDQLLQRRQ